QQQRQLDVRGEPRSEHEQAPHAVDDRGYPREQLDRDRDRPRQQTRAEFGEEHRDAHRQRQRERQREKRRDQRADDRPRRAVNLGHGVPFARREEAEAELAQRRPAADRERDEDTGQRREQQGRRGEAGGAEDRLF